MIKSVHLENWKTHQKSTFEFSKGTNVIVGRMGAGKSSIMDAISFALYGSFPSLAARKVSLEETIMCKPIKQEKAVVSLEFDYNGKNYEVERIVKRSGINEGQLWENGRLTAGPKTTDVTKKISEILEADYDLFSRAIYSEQNQIDYFLRLSPSQRKEKFDELLGLDRYEKVRSNAVTLGNRIKKTAEDRKNFLFEQRKKNDPKQLEELELRLAGKQRELAQKIAELEKYKISASAKEAELAQISAKEKEYRVLRDTQLRAKSKLDSLSEEMSKMKERLKGEHAAKIKSQLESAQASIREIARKKIALEKELLVAEKVVQQIKEERASLRTTLDANAKSLTNAKSIGAQCPVCKRPMSEHDRSKLESELHEEDEKICKKIAQIEKNLEKADLDSGKIDEKLSFNEKEKENAQKEAESLRRLFEISSELEDKEKLLAEKDKELSKISKQLSENDFDEEKLLKTRDEYYSAKESVLKISAEIRSAEEVSKELSGGIERISSAEEQIRQLEKQAEKLEKTGQKISIFTSALKSTQAELRSTMIDTINEAMEEIWQRIYPYRDYTTARIMVDEGNYEVMVRQLSGEWARVEGILSGGERSSVALTMRIAVSLVLTQNLGWIILDEPTHNLDANSVKELSETLRSHLPEIIGQVFIITHDKEMEYAASGKLYVLEREKEKDGVTRIAE